MSTKIQKAFKLAVISHKNECRKMGMPFVFHPIDTANILHQYGFGEDIICAGLLHDTLEHKVCTRSELKKFDKNVYRIINQVTAKPNKDWKQKKLDYMEGIVDEDVKIVALADKISNLKETYRYKNENVWKIFKTGYEGQFWYYSKLIDVLKINHEIYDEFVGWFNKVFKTTLK